MLNSKNNPNGSQLLWAPIKDDHWDNAVAESFFASVEFELIEQQTFATRQMTQSELFHYIEVFYNRQRRH